MAPEPAVNVTDVTSQYDGQKLTLPAVPATFIKLLPYDGDDSLSSDHLQSSVAQPFAISPVLKATVSSSKLLIEGPDVKSVYDVRLTLPAGTDLSWLPGDTIGILTYNFERHVNSVLQQLSSSSEDELQRVTVDPDTKKKAAKLPPYVPTLVTVRRLLTEVLNLDAVPKKLFIRALVDHTTDQVDKRFLEILCAKEAAAVYDELIVKRCQGFVSFLKTVPSCRPPISLLIEHLPRLMPRPYSMANVPRQHNAPDNALRIIFSHDCQSPGLTTSYLKELTVGELLYCYMRQSTGFTIKDDQLESDIVMVGTGTGIAPFLSFLEYRKASLECGHRLGEAFLFVGFRYNESYIGKSEIEDFLQRDILTRCVVALSRETESDRRYVQDELDSNGTLLADVLLRPNAKLYVCGDGKLLLPQVQAKVEEVLQTVVDDGKQKVAEMRKSGQYLEDVWL